MVKKNGSEVFLSALEYRLLLVFVNNPRVIVTRGRKRGLLLPNLEGVDTVEEQLSIARQKAGIREDETDVELERFEIIRHGVKS